MKKRIILLITLVGFSITLMSWGWEGHNKISTNAGLSFNQQMSQFNAWIPILALHASDADTRKNDDPTEAPKHYIDIDSYNQFIYNGRIPQTFDSIIAIYGESFVYENGILPWATMTAFDSLRNCFQRHDWNKAELFAADLGHYVGDGHMPLHITKNYNGYDTGNDGIHSRYESNMVGDHISEINYLGDSISAIPNVNQYIFNYLYTNYTYVDSVLLADDYAKSINSNTHSSEYKAALWNKTKNFTILLFKNASHSLAELIYTAWVQAGSPQIASSSILSPIGKNQVYLEQNIPNPFTNSTRISFTLNEKSNVTLQVNDMSGSTVATLLNGSKNGGSYQIDWQPQNLSSGIYYLVLNTEKIKQVKKMLLIN